MAVVAQAASPPLTTQLTEPHFYLQFLLLYLMAISSAK